MMATDAANHIAHDVQHLIVKFLILNIKNLRKTWSPFFHHLLINLFNLRPITALSQLD